MHKAILILLIQIISLVNFGYSQDLPAEIQEQIKNFSNPEKIKYLGDFCWSMREEKNEEAIQCGHYAVKLADSLELYSPAAEISNYLGVCMMYYIYDTKDAWKHFRDALSYSVKSNDSIQLGYAYDNLAYLYLIYGDVSNAFKNERIAEKIFTTRHYDEGLAYISTNMGLVYQEKGEYDTAIEYFYRARILHTKNNNEIGIAAALSCIGETYVLKNNPDSALVYFEKQLQISEKTGHQKYRARALKGIGEGLYQSGKYTEALEMLNQATELCLEKNDFHLLIDIRIAKALILAKMGRTKEDEKEMQEALVLAIKLRFPKSIYNFSKGYSEFYKIVGFDEKAAETFQELFELYNSMYKDLQKETIINENQIFGISQNLELAKNEIAFKKSREIMYYLIFALLLVFGVFHIRRFRINKMLYNKVRQKNFEIELEINKKNQALKALEKSEKELKISNATKDKFFSIIAHDLKSPFNAILGFSRVLYEDYEDFEDKEKIEMAKRINEMSQRTYNLVENLLVWSGSQTNRIVFKPEPLSLINIMHDNILLQRPNAEKKNIILHSDIENNTLVFADKDMLNTVLRNLISNAVKFTPDYGLVSVGASEDWKAGTMLVWVEDSGIGIPPEQQELLFEFSQVISVPGTRNETGTGIGLALCKEFIEIHGGTILVESLPGEGSKFSFTLPISQPD